MFQKKSYFEITYATIVKISEEVKVKEDLENFEKELEKLAIEIYTPDIAFTEAI